MAHTDRQSRVYTHIQKGPALVASVALVVLFFMPPVPLPWLRIVTREATTRASGWQLGRLADLLGTLAKHDTPLITSYVLAAIPILALVFGVLLLRQEKTTPHHTTVTTVSKPTPTYWLGLGAALLPIVLFFVLWLQVGQNFLSSLGVGYWLVLLAAFVLLLAVATPLGLARAIDTVAIGIGKVMFWLSLAMVLVGTYNVITRYLGNRLGMQLSSNMYLELQTYAYNLIFLLGAPYVLLQNDHVRIDILTDRLKPKQKAMIDIFGAIFLLLPLCLLGIYFSQKYIASSFASREVSPNEGGLWRYPIKFVIIVAFVLLIFQALSETIKNLAFIRGVPNSGSMHALPPADTPTISDPTVTDSTVIKTNTAATNTAGNSAVGNANNNAADSAIQPVAMTTQPFSAEDSHPTSSQPDTTQSNTTQSNTTKNQKEAP